MSLFNITFSNLQIIKFSFILFMFFVHLYILILFWCNKDISNYEQIKSDIRYSGIIDINFLKKIVGYLISAGGAYSSAITIADYDNRKRVIDEGNKNVDSATTELDIKNKELLFHSDGVNSSINYDARSVFNIVGDKLKEIKKLNLNITKTEEEIYELQQSEKEVSIFVLLRDPQFRINIIKEIKYKQYLLDRDINKRSELMNEAESICYKESIDFIDIDKSQRSTIFDFESLMTFIDSIDIFYRVALFLLFFKGIIISSTISIIFVLYGDYLLVKYDIEKRFPKLAKIIQLRRKLQRYYLILAISWILIVSFTEVLFCVSVLFL